MPLFKKLSAARNDEPAPPKPDTEPSAGTGLPTRALPKVLGTAAVALALYVAFHGSSKPAVKHHASAPAPSPQTNARPKPAQYEDILNHIEASVHKRRKAHNKTPPDHRNPLGPAMPTPKNVAEQRQAKHGNIAASPIVALQGDAQSPSAGQAGHGESSANATDPNAVPGGHPLKPVTQVSAPQGTRRRKGSQAQHFLKRIAHSAGKNYGPQARVLPPLHGAVLYPGAVLPSTTITAVNTQLPGTVTAQVTRDVYGRNGRVAVPKGSRLVGQYDTTVRNGQTRVLVAFQRVIFPDGRELVLGNAQASGPRGAAGTKAHVNNHFWKMLGASLLVALLDQGVAAVGPKHQVTTPSGATFRGSSQVGAQTFAGVAGKVLAPYTNLKPTAVIPPGTAINVLVNKTVLMPRQGGGQ